MLVLVIDSSRPQRAAIVKPASETIEYSFDALVALMTAAYDLAAALDDCFLYLENDCKRTDKHPEIRVARTALKKAGW